MRIRTFIFATGGITAALLSVYDPKMQNCYRRDK